MVKCMDLESRIYSCVLIHFFRSSKSCQLCTMFDMYKPTLITELLGFDVIRIRCGNYHSLVLTSEYHCTNLTLNVEQGVYGFGCNV